MKESVIAEIKITPLGTATASLSRYVAACINPLKQAQDISYQLTATTINIDDCRDKSITIDSKVKAVTEAGNTS